MKTIKAWMILGVALCALPALGDPPASWEEEKKRVAANNLKDADVAVAKASDESAKYDKRLLALIDAARLPTPQSAKLLETWFDRPPNPSGNVKTVVLELINDSPSPAYLPLIKRAMKDKTSDARWRAGRSLGLIEGEKALPEIEKLAAAETDPSAKQELDLVVSDLKELPAKRAATAEVIDVIIAWGRSRDSGIYLKGDELYFQRSAAAPIPESEMVRVYAEPELKFLDRLSKAFVISRMAVNGDMAVAQIKYAQEPPSDPVFPYSGWSLTLKKTGGKWKVTEAKKNGKQ